MMLKGVSIRRNCASMAGMERTYSQTGARRLPCTRVKSPS